MIDVVFKPCSLSINRDTLKEKSITSIHAISLIPLSKPHKLSLVCSLRLSDKLEQRRFEFEFRKRRNIKIWVNLDKVHFWRAMEHIVWHLELNIWGKVFESILSNFVEESFMIRVLDFQLLSSKVKACFWSKNPASGHFPGWPSVMVRLHEKGMRVPCGVWWVHDHFRSFWAFWGVLPIFLEVLVFSYYYGLIRI